MSRTLLSGLRAALLAAAVVIVAPAFAVSPEEVLADPALEARARAISAELRCLVCQNQSIDDSDADLAGDLRRLVRERLLSGDSDEEVIAFLVSRYGEFVLLKPQFSNRNLLLWATPAIALLAGGAFALFAARRRKPAPTALTPEESAALDDLLKRVDDV
ncbi:MAG: cytochrome c-type biogenesis protein CcmH [Phyllobacteriaceae bacterium]|nr:cytochrome c-type biogenesis protein CcmH [Phyllobacteriaceae bacterium]